MELKKLIRDFKNIRKRKLKKQNTVLNLIILKNLKIFVRKTKN